jgi:hypothetical protein
MRHQVRQPGMNGDAGTGGSRATGRTRAVAVAVAGMTVLAAMAAARLAVAGGSWQAIGPSGGTARLTIDPSTPATLYASTGTRIFKTVDGGQTWLPTDAGIPPSAFVGQVTIDPVSPATLFVVSGGGVWRSGDGGARWRHLRQAPARASSAVVVDPAAHLTVYVGAGNKVWKSLDGGVTWAPTGGSLAAGASIDCLAIDPQRPASLYAGTDLGLFRSVNGGASWLGARSGIGSLQVVLNLTVDPYVEGTVWAGVQSGAPSLEGLFVSRNSGAAWQRVAAVSENVFCFAISPARGHPLYACSHGSVLRSIDAGRDWQSIDNGLTGGSFASVVVDPAAPNILYVSAGLFQNSGPAVFKSENGGAVWQASSAGIYAQSITALAVSPAAAGTVYAGTEVSSVFRSADNGATWTNANPGLNGIDVLALALDPLVTSKVYVNTNRAFFASDDSGAAWTRPGARFAGGSLLVASPQASGELYASNGGAPLSRTTDGGVTWAPLTAAPSFTAIRVVAIAPSDPATLYLSTLTDINDVPISQLYVSRDGGATFTALATSFLDVVAVAVDPADPSTLYVSAGDADLGVTGALYKSVDGGQTFNPLSGVAQLAPLLVDATNPSVVYGATLTLPADVLVSRDAGATWSELAPGLPGALVGQLAFGSPGTLYAGTQGASVYSLTLDSAP